MGFFGSTPCFVYQVLVIPTTGIDGIDGDDDDDDDDDVLCLYSTSSPCQSALLCTLCTLGTTVLVTEFRQMSSKHSCVGCLRFEFSGREIAAVAKVATLLFRYHADETDVFRVRAFRAGLSKDPA